VDFFVNPSTDVRVTYIKAYWADNTTDSVVNQNITWSQGTANNFADFRYLTGVYKFDFRGSISNGGASFSNSVVDTVR
jgi:hypothetical protein